MYYHRRPPERRTREYFMPFFMIIMLAIILVFGWRILNAFLIEGSQGTTNERAFLAIENGSVKAMAADSAEWKSVPDKIYLYRGEKLKTGGDGRASLTFFNQSLIRLDHDSEIEITQLKSSKDADLIELQLNEGNLWAKTDALNNPDSQFQMNTKWLSVSARDGSFALTAPGTVYMIDGNATVSVMQESETVRTYTLGVGQEFLIDEEGLVKLSRAESPEVIFAINDSFKQSDFYQWNQGKDGVVTVGTTETSPETVGTETETANAVEEPASTPGPATPTITEPGKNGETVALTTTESVIAGTVSADTEKVIINDYELQRFTAGSKSFRYVAKTSYDNLKVGENEFKVYAKDKAGNVSEPATIILTLTQEVADAHKEEASSGSAETIENTSSAENTGGVTITEPNEGKDFTTTETEFNLKGIVPANTAKVLVNDYALSRYVPGATNWSYKAYKSLGSLEIGKRNTYVVVAKDAEGNTLGTDRITIDVESEGAPVITIPTPRNSYLTSLNELVLGGTAGKWVQVIYVNDQKLLNYIPGSEKWHHTVTLQPGKNTYRVQGETNGVKTASDEIEITYQP